MHDVLLMRAVWFFFLLPFFAGRVVQLLDPLEVGTKGSNSWTGTNPPRFLRNGEEEPGLTRVPSEFQRNFLRPPRSGRGDARFGGWLQLWGEKAVTQVQACSRS